MKFYALAHAGRSAAQSALEAADDFIELMSDPGGARLVIEQHALPLLAQFQLTDMIVPARSHYAIVLAWCGEANAARREIAKLALFGGTDQQQAMLAERSRAVELIASGKARLGAEHRRNQFLRSPGASRGPNQPCPCGSGKKYKRCHGAG